MIRQVNSLAYGMGYFTLLVYVDPVVPVTFQPSFLLVGDKHEQTHTHTCSEISYRITDVECIGRAQTIP